jgi:glycerol-3-phosphate acyltransferase PlsY
MHRVGDMVMRDAGLILAAYLVGSIPFGVVVARARGGVDLRRVGSGNIGATNVLRAVGKGAAALTLLGDIGKGAAAVGLGRWFGVSPTVLAMIALAAVVGHLLPVFAGFRGGKGVATTLGVVLAAMPAVGGLLLLIWLAVAGIWRYSSLAALVASAALPFLAWWLDGRPPMVVLSATLLFIVLVRHRENIGRLWQGQEGKIGQKARTSSGQMVG